MKYTPSFLILLFLSLTACQKNENSEIGSAITEPGVYSVMDTLKLHINVTNNMVVYSLKNELNKDVLDGSTKHEFSDLHRWAFYVDKKSIWVLSSDMGYFVYVYDSSKKQFDYQLLPFEISKDDYPPYVYRALPDFFD
jgi:hypothetical protein